MKIKFILTLCILIIIVTIFSAGTSLAEDRTDPPSGCVVTDGTTYYWIDLHELFISYLSYRLDPNSGDGRLAKFYFDTLGNNVMSNMAAYVSAVTNKFVSFNGLFQTYAATRDADQTYIWFNSSDPADATPAFDVITEVLIVGPEATVTGKVYVGVDGYIITLSTPGIIIPGTTRMRIEANQTDVQVNLFNPAANPCYFVISLKLSDGTVLYESDMLLPGEAVSDIVLTQPVPYGEHEASILYEAFSLDDLSPLNNAEIEIKLIAE